MRITGDGRVIWSASDLKKAADCEFAWARAIDARLGRTVAVDEEIDATMRRAIDLGLEHEHRVLESYRQTHGDGVVEIADVSQAGVEARAAAVVSTSEALRDPNVRVIYQGAFESDDFLGFADFLVRTPEGWLVQDTKLARTARVSALMQLAAYADRIQAQGVDVAPTVELILGTGEVSSHALVDIAPVFRLRRSRIRALIADRDVASGTESAALAWGDERGDLDVLACGRCATCEQQVIATRDLLLVAGMRPLQRRRLRAAGITTIDELADAVVVPDDMPSDTFADLRTQARLQVVSPAGVVPVPGEKHAVPLFDVVLPSALAILPPADDGDIFFDFEGDPLYTEDDRTRWGLDYLFGWVDDSETYTALWAHSFAAEKQALQTFLTTLKLIRTAHPGMHVYHYAPYETSHLLAMAARHGVGEAEVDALLADGVFVDLYPIVKRAVRVGSRSYSIKKLEPLYMGDDVRTADVQRGDESIERYAHARELLALGRDSDAQPILDDLADYNRYDCVSTRRLRDWLRERAADAGITAAESPEVETARYEPSPRSIALIAEADALVASRDDDVRSSREAALRLSAAALDYHPRENRAFWSEHYLRLREPLSMWNSARDVLTVNAARSFVRSDWAVGERARVPARTLVLRGDLTPGSSLRPGSTVFTVYERPVPFPAMKAARWVNVPLPAEVVDVREDGLVISERGVADVPWQRLPVAVVPGPPPSTAAIQGRVEMWADRVLATAPDFPADAASDLLSRRVPRTRSGAAVWREGDRIEAVVASVLDLDRSYLAVQGPPGTGKTRVGSHVIARLVRDHGYRVGVVAQSHAVVENLLARVVDAGVPLAQVGKAVATLSDDEERFTEVGRNAIGRFRAEHESRARGFVLGGTAWDFCNNRRILPQSLDLLVIDEAGQYSLANTIATATAARDLLLLGDPQQLPQVSQGTHSEPVDTSALGWIMNGDDVLRPEFGYFLEQSWRMHPAVADVISALSYAGELRAAPAAAARSIDGVEAGVHPVPVRHRGDTAFSDAEADAVVALVRDLIGRSWIPDEGCEPQPLTGADIIVVTPYNAQQEVVSTALVGAGIADVRVGTVDKFQGQEAAVSIVSLAASSSRDAARGLEFLLLQNRLNVAVSRAQVAAYIVHSPGLFDDLPATPDAVARLSAFAKLVRDERV